MKLSIENMEVPLFRNDKYMIGLEEQSIRDQCNRHLSVLWKNFVEQGCNSSQVINDNDSHPHVIRNIT